MKFSFVPRWLLSVEDDGRFFRRLYLFGMSIRIRRRKVLPASPSVWKRYERLPVQEDKILLRSTLRGYAGHAKYIAEEIRRQQLPYKIVWIIQPDALDSLGTFPRDIEVIMDANNVWRAYATAKVIYDDHFRFLPLGYKKKAGQFCLWSWHGYPYKKVCHQAPADPGVFNTSHWRRYVPDFILAGSPLEKHILRCMYTNKGEARILGYPRNDIFFRPDLQGLRKRVLESLGIPVEKKILFYAPTWRDGRDMAWNKVDLPAVLKALEHRFGEKWVVMTRMHYIERVSRSREFLNVGNLYDVTLYPDTQELLVAADALLTDYSSIQADYYLTGKPIFLYVPDCDVYLRTRGFYCPFEDLPAPKARNNDELVRTIETYDEVQYHKRLHAHVKEMGIPDDGHASERTVELIKQLAPIN